MRKFAAIAAVAISAALPTTSYAWWDSGHMRVAAIAYEQLSPQAKAEASRLLKLNPKYGEWAAAVPAKPDGTPGDVDQYVFIRAAVWADDIKTYKDYTRDNDTATGPYAARNVGYSDKLVHDYWHYKDIPFSTDGSTWPPQDPVNAETQIKLFSAALPVSAGKSDDIRSYDLSWLIHLIGDVHQPLHSTAYFNKALHKMWQDRGKPDLGDRGGNEITVVPADGKETKLHFYWDGIFGGYSTPLGAIADNGADKIPAPADAFAKELDPAQWLEESHDLALQFAYSAPVALDPTQPVMLTREYETNARKVAEAQISLAGYRLANLLNDAFK
ncbi:S1/P1 nuclease [Rhizobium mongolense]|uniref:S1/P1 nuclease n=2 Tax=Rhizobium mongolense TaxID=57676 RepID=A0A559SLB2_9HYPH|nr:S1/P1 nuclease [Rhizobium mongolense]TVZ63139.1 S1/P1 nuclease [Rhizobium mongolense USDA 1844]